MTIFSNQRSPTVISIFQKVSEKLRMFHFLIPGGKNYENDYLRFLTSAIYCLRVRKIYRAEYKNSITSEILTFSDRKNDLNSL